MRKQFIKYSIALPLILLCWSISAQINTGSPGVPFGSNTSYEYGIMPTNLPSSGTYGASNDAANQYSYWKNQFVASCSGGQYRVKFDNASETVSEGIAYGLLIAAYAADKDLFDGLWAYYKANSNGNGVMNWKINGCSGATGQNGAADAEIDAAMALIVAEHQWPSSTSPYDYGSEANTLISAIESTEIHPSSYQLINGDAWGFGNNCRNPSYQAPAYYKVYAEHTGNNSWTNNMVPAAYTLINNNVNGSTGLVSNWSDPSGSANGCNGPNEYGYDACRSPWRMGTDVIWFDDSDAKTICNDLASYTSGVGAGNVGGPRPQSGGNGGTHNTTFVSTYAAGVMGANSSYQSHMNAMYSETVSVSDNAYFGETLKTIMLFMMTGNFWNPFTVGGSGNPTCSIPDLGVAQSICGQSSINLNSGLNTDGVKTFRWYKDNSPQGGASTSANTFTVTSAGEYKVVIDSIGQCTSESIVTISGVLTSPDLGSDIQICASPTETLDANVSGSAVNYSWKKDNVTIVGEDSQTLDVSETGTYEVTVSAASCGSESDEIVVTSALPTATGDTICSSGEVTLTATGGSSPYNWYTSEGATGAAGTGATFQPTISSSSTYWLEANGSGGGTVSVGPSNSGSSPWNISDFSTDDKKLYIDPLTDVTLISISVEAAGNTNVTINIYNDGTNQLIETETVSIGSGMQAIPLSASLSTGTRYRIDAVGTNTGLEFKNQGNPSYPITESGVVTLTNTTSWNASWSLFFNLEFSTGQSCSRIPVEAVIDPSNDNCVAICTEPNNVSIDQGASVSLCPSDDITLTTNNQPNSSDFDFIWYQGNYPGGSIIDGPTGNVNHLDFTVSYGNASNYTIVVRDKNNPTDASCIKTATINISDLTAPNASITTSGDDLEYCEGGAGVTLSATNAGSGASYSWSGPETGAGINLSDATAGTYSVSVIKDGCTAVSSSVTVIENLAPNATILTSGDDLEYCEGTGGATLEAQNVSGASYSWAGPVNGSMGELSNATSGSYSLLVSLNGCLATDDVIVVENSNPVANIETSGSELEYCSGGAGVSLTAEVAGTGAIYTWSGPVTGSGIELEDATTGTYSVKVTKDGCSATSSTVEVSESSGISVSITNTSNDLTYCEGDAGVTLTASNVGGGIYSWYKNGSPISSGNPLIESIEGDYYVEVTAGGCSATSSTVTVEEKANPNATITTSGNDLQYCEGTSGVILEAQNVANATYSWFGPITGNGMTLTNATGGSYELVVTLDGCSSIDNVAVMENSNPVATIETSGSELEYCSGGAGVSLTAEDAGTGATYTWSGPVTGSGITLQEATTGTYSVQVTKDGCSAISSAVDVTESGGISVSITNTSNELEYCESDNGVALMASTVGGGVYSWFKDGNSIGSGNPLNNATEGEYYVEVTSESCSATSTTVTVGEKTSPNASITTSGGDLSYCEGVNGLTLNAQSVVGATYTWSGPVSGSSSTLDNVTAGNYDVTVDLNGCSNTSSQVVVIENSLPVAAIESSGNDLSYCSGSSGVTLTASNAGSGASYEWFDGAVSIGNGNPIQDVLEGDYSVTVEKDGCTNISPVVAVVEGGSVTSEFTASATEYCEGENGVTLTAENAGAGASYTWLANSQNAGSGQVLSNALVGTYTLEVTSGTCSATSTDLTISENASPVAEITTTELSYCEGEDGITLNATPTSGASYSWSGAVIGSTASITNAVAGEYSVTVTVGECSSTSNPVTVIENELPVAEINASALSYCENETGVLLNAVNAGSGTQYSWTMNTQFAGAEAELSNALAGSYELTVTLNGCETTSSTIVVSENSNPNAQITTNRLGLVYCQGTEGSNLQAATVVGSTYEWFRGNTSVGTGQSFNAALSGTYTVVVTKDGCSATSTGKTTQEIPLPDDAGNITGTIQACEGVVETYSIQAVANTTNYNWEVSTGSTIITNSGTTVEVELAGGGGQLKVTPSNSCGIGGSSTISINVTGAVNPEVAISSQQNPVCEGGVAVMNANSSNGGSAPSYQWFENGIQVGSNSSSHVVTDVANNDELRVEMTSNSTCANGVVVSSQLFELQTAQAPVITTVFGPDTVCNSNSAAIDFEVTDNVSSSYNWNVPPGATVVGQGTSRISVDFTNVSGQSELVSVSELSAEGCASDVAFKFITLSCLVAVNHILDPSLVSVYPNPFKDNVEIELDLFSNMLVQLDVLNANGVLVNKRFVTSKDQISLGDDLDPGVYWLKFLQGDQLLVKKVVKLD